MGRKDCTRKMYATGEEREEMRFEGGGEPEEDGEKEKNIWKYVNEKSTTDDNEKDKRDKEANGEEFHAVHACVARPYSN